MVEAFDCVLVGDRLFVERATSFAWPFFVGDEGDPGIEENSVAEGELPQPNKEASGETWLGDFGSGLFRLGEAASDPGDSGSIFKCVTS